MTSGSLRSDPRVPSWARTSGEAPRPELARRGRHDAAAYRSERLPRCVGASDNEDARYCARGFCKCDLCIPLPSDTVVDLCRQVVKERRWFVDEVGPTHISARTAERNPLKPPPIVIRIDLVAVNGGTRVNLKGAGRDASGRSSVDRSANTLQPSERHWSSKRAVKERDLPSLHR
jgi:hypothetical protein